MGCSLIAEIKKQASSHWNTYTEQHGRALGSSPLHNAEAL